MGSRARERMTQNMLAQHARTREPETQVEDHVHIHPKVFNSPLIGSNMQLQIITNGTMNLHTPSLAHDKQHCFQMIRCEITRLFL